MKLFPAFCLMLATILLNTNAWAKGDLAVDLASGELWRMDQTAFQQKYLSGERGSWLNDEKTSLRMPKPEITIGDMKLGETILNWTDQKLASIQIMIYNKGDNGIVSKDKYDQQVSTTLSTLNKATAHEGKSYKPRTADTGTKIDPAYQWNLPGATITMEAGNNGKSKGFEPEFIRIRILSKTANAEKKSGRIRLSDIRANVKREGSQVIIDNIPMVDQGQKGYCVVATAARVFAYYGKSNIDQHALAAAADTTADGGTSLTDMERPVARIASKFQMRLGKYSDNLDSVRKYESFIKDYNRHAKKMDKSQIGDLRNLALVWNMADGEVLKAMRAGKPSDIESWMKPMRKDINNGIPILWSVELGLVPEPMIISQTRGGHMRLIIGYDDQKKVIFFSDSWGKEHAVKEMPMADAAAITVTRLTLEPRS